MDIVVMVKKILFLVLYPFSDRDIERFGIELLKENGFETEVWDLTGIVYPGLKKQVGSHDPYNREGCRSFNDKKTALKEIRRISPETFIIADFYCLPERYAVWKAISASPAKYAVFMPNALPATRLGERVSFLHHLKRIRKVTVKKLIDQAFFRAPLAWLGIRPPSLILAGGEGSLQRKYFDNKKTEVVWAHTLDYDLYLKYKNDASGERPTAVFLDEFLAFWGYATPRPPVKTDEYYSMLNRFFDLVEEKTGLEVIIASHPTAYYERLPDYFNKRKCIKGQTARLVKESQLVLNHGSTAVNFANLFYKPVIFLTYSDLDNHQFGSHIREMARWFGKEPIFLDRENATDWQFERTVNKTAYNAYRRAYIKGAHSEELPFWQIAANRLKKGF